ncbi:MAG: hypothetical protein AAF726_07900 [Planctomycetota bacterium]
MKEHRLSRLLRVRRREERALQLQWASAAQSARHAAATREAGRDAVQRAQEELDAAAQAGVPRVRLAAEAVLDALVADKTQHEAELREANERASQAQAALAAKSRETQGLERLEAQWRQECRRWRRRREERERQESTARTGGEAR